MTNVNMSYMNKTLADLCVAHEVMAGTVAWNDGQRAVENCVLSCFGDNITDCKLKMDDGTTCPYLKSHNFDERLGVTKAKHVIVGVEDGKEITAQHVLNTIKDRAAKFGFSNVDVPVDEDETVVVRVQNAFVPMNQGEIFKKVVPTHYSYNTFKDRPRNLLVSGYNGSISVNQDSTGENPLYALKQEDGRVTEHFYTVKPSSFDVGGAQSTVDGIGQPPEVGLKGMGGRGNALVVMSIPNTLPSLSSTDAESDSAFVTYRSLSAGSDASSMYRSVGVPNFGEAKAATLSVDETSMGDFVCVDPPIQRKPDEPIVITVIYYNTLQDLSRKPGQLCVPHISIANAVGDMDRAYKLCLANGRLSTLPAMLQKMTPETIETITKKMRVDPITKVDPFAFTTTALADVE